MAEKVPSTSKRKVKTEASDDFPCWTVKRLKDYLSDRNVSCSGRNKSDLIKLCFTARDKNIPKNEPDTFHQTRKERLTFRGKILKSPSDIRNFTTNLSGLPHLDWVNIVHYLMTKMEWTSKRLSELKSSRGYVLYKNGHIHSLSIAEHDGFTYVKAFSVRETSITDKKKDYPVCVIFSKNGQIVTAFCDCTADDGACKHVIAYLLQIESLSKYSGSCTDKPCQWSLPRVSAAPAEYLQLEAHSKSQGVATFNPFKDLDAAANAQAVRKMLKDGAQYNAVALTSYSDSDDSESEDTTNIASIESLALDYRTTSPNIPFVTYLCEQVNSDVREKIEIETRDQSLSDQWSVQRKYRITASKMHNILNAKAKTLLKPDNYIVASIIGNEHFIGNTDTEYGHKFEQVAREIYISRQTPLHPGLKVITNGLFIHETEPYLGASPDGLVSCSCHGDGLLEIKTFPSKRHTPVTELIKSGPKNFDLHYNEHGESSLKKNSKFYTQVQFQMLVTGRKFCDLVVYTEVPPYIAVTRVDSNSLFQQKCLISARQFYIDYIIPKLVDSTQ